MQCVLRAHVGQEPRDSDGAIGPRQFGAWLTFEHCAGTQTRPSCFGFDPAKQLLEVEAAERCLSLLPVPGLRQWLARIERLDVIADLLVVPRDVRGDVV